MENKLYDTTEEGFAAYQASMSDAYSEPSDDACSTCSEDMLAQLRALKEGIGSPYH